MSPIKTLLADDHALVRTGLRDALTSLPDIEVTGEVGNGPDLLAALNDLQPDLLVMDVNMPDFEPVEAVKSIKIQYPHIKILVVSAYDDQSYVVGLLSAGVNGYHLKDQPLSDLQMAVQRILNGGRWISDPLVDRLVTQRSDTQESISLTRRQRELLYLLSQGYNNKKIALTMNLSVKTVENHLTALYRAIGVESRLEANKFSSRFPELISFRGHELPQGKSEQISPETFTVVVVDDNPRYRAQLGKLIRKTQPQPQVYETGDVADAIHLTDHIKPRLAFVDVVLHEEDGIQCARRIKEISPDTRIVLISAYPDREFRRLGLNAGAVAFLDKKDIDARTVRQLVEDAMMSQFNPE